MKKALFFLFCLLWMFSCREPNAGGGQNASPYIAKVFDYCPAPGQFVNTIPLCEEGETKETVLARANELLVGGAGRSVISLGAWGGYVVLGFDHAVVNNPDAFDFKVYGNAYDNSAEPGIVMVSVDENGNGQPDDKWYELRGSEYDSVLTIHHYHCVYYRPDSLTADIFWKDNQGNSGYVTRNTYHAQSYYPLWETADSLVFEGSLLESNAYREGNSFRSPGFAWGYADNAPNHSEKACFDIDWAVNENGFSVKLEAIHFIKIYTAQQQFLGWLGETSTEISGIEDL